MNNVETDIYIKDANTGLYVQYHSYEHWNTKTAWERSLYDRAQKISSNQHLFMTQVNYLKKLCDGMDALITSGLKHSSYYKLEKNVNKRTMIKIWWYFYIN